MCLEVRENREPVIQCRDASDQRATILLVEDEAFVREVTGEVLRSAGYQVLAASSAAEAESLFDACRGEMQLLLTDVVLPGETGRVLAEKLRREKAELKVLLVTGYAEEMAALEASQMECLRKPFSTVVLLRRVRQLLDHPGPGSDGIPERHGG
jgi:two-component system, cell cycle sensor histidine kinase and response regulator CckA